MHIVIEIERQVHVDAMKVMDDFYQQNTPYEDIRLENILQTFEKSYLGINLENKTLKKRIKITK